MLIKDTYQQESLNFYCPYDVKSKNIFFWNLGCNAAKCNNQNQCIIGKYEQDQTEQYCSLEDCSSDVVWISSNIDGDDGQGISLRLFNFHNFFIF